MVSENFDALENRCYCLFDCECYKVEKLITEWTSLEALETVKSRLLSLSDPAEIFARFACMLFFRQILDGVAVKSTKDNLRKATIAFSFAASCANEENDIVAFYTSCWQRFQHLASMLDKNLSHITIRRRFPLPFFVDEVFSLDSVDSNIAQQNGSQCVQSHFDFTPETPLEEVSPQLDYSIPETLQSLDNRQIEGFASSSEENIPQTLPPLISTIVEAISLDLTDDFQPMLSLDSNEPNRDPSPTSEVANEQNSHEFDDLDDPTLDEEKPPADFSIPEPVPDVHQNENVSLRGTRSMPSKSANQRVMERSASKGDEKKPKTETPVAANGVESADKKITEPKEELEEIAEPCDTLIATRTQPCHNVQTKTVNRSENRKERVGEPEKKRARPVGVATDCSSSSDLQTSSRPSMEAGSQSPQEPMEQSENIVAEADVLLPNTSRPRRTRRTRAAMIAVEADDNDGQPNEKRVSERSCDAERCSSARKSTNIATTYFMLKFWYEEGHRPSSHEIEELSKNSNLTINQVQSWFSYRRRYGVPNESIERSMLLSGRCENSYFAHITWRKIENAALLLKEFYKMIDHPFPKNIEIEKIATAAGLPQSKVTDFFTNRCKQLRAHVNKKSAIVSEQLKQFGISEEQLLSFDWIRNKKEQRTTDSRTSEMLCRFYAVNMSSEGKLMPGDIPESTRSLLERLTGWDWKMKIRKWFASKQRHMSGKSLAMLRSMAQRNRHPHEFRFGAGRNEKFDYFEDRYID